MWLGNLMLLVLNLPLIEIWVRMIAIPYHYLFPTLSDHHSFLRDRRVQRQQMLLAFILGPMMEEFLRR
jgi:TctA family transporter